MTGLAALLADAGRLVSWGGAEDVAAAVCDYGAAVLRFTVRAASAEAEGGDFNHVLPFPSLPFTARLSVFESTSANMHSSVKGCIVR